jgi:hypothetical protein
MNPFADSELAEFEEHVNENLGGHDLLFNDRDLLIE